MRGWSYEQINEIFPGDKGTGGEHAIESTISAVENYGKDSPTLPLVLAAVCVGTQEKSQYNLGLPTKKARRLMQANEQTFTAAYKDFVQALKHGGWIS